MKNSETSYTLKLWIRVSEFECDPDDITAALGVDPSRVSRKGEKFSERTDARSRHNAWQLESPADERNSTVSDQLEAIVKVLGEKVQVFRDLPIGSKVECVCIVYAYEYMPGLHFTPKNVEFLEKMTAGIDLDIYDQTQNPREEGQVLPFDSSAR